jgi:hypothetical protein
LSTLRLFRRRGASRFHEVNVRECAPDIKEHFYLRLIQNVKQPERVKTLFTWAMPTADELVQSAAGEERIDANLLLRIARATADHVASYPAAAK